MRKTFLKTAREKLGELRKQVLQEMDQDLRAGRESGKEEGMDTYDLASEERDREISFILTDRDREKLQAIQDSITRINEGTYGVCENCEAEIAEGRLLALPFTRLCVTCQGEAEKEAKSAKRFDDDRTYRKLGATDDADDNS